jgi:hypothetical protein
VARSQSYAQIADVLHIDEAVIRDRAHRAVVQLAPTPGDLDPEAREVILDYVLGQAALSAGARAELRRSAAARRWTIALTEALSPLIGKPLAPRAPARARVAPSVPVRPPAVRVRAPWRGLSGITAAIAIIAVVIALVSSSTTSRSPRRPLNPHRIASVPAVETVRQLVLTASGGGSAVGVGAVIRQGSALLLTLQASRLAPNRGNVYAVWLFNTRADSRLLGLVSPPVGATGTFSSRVLLPPDAIRYRSILVTRQRSSRPHRPGAAVLRGNLSLA